MAWVAPKYTYNEIDAAGDTLISSAATDAERQDAYTVVNSWRACHAFPLNTFQMSLRRNCAPATTGKRLSVVAQRIKRLPAIIHKLDRLRRLKLSVLQDIGGCRAILANVALVHDVRAQFQKSAMRHKLLQEDDYIAKPKKSGYRGIHLVYQYLSDRTSTYNGLKIEVQLRSRLQHAWATCVETVQLFSAEKLKSSQGDPRWLRFFALMSSVIAVRESGVLVPGTPQVLSETIEELRGLERILKARAKLVAYGAAIENVLVQFGSYFLLKLDTQAKHLEVRSYRREDFARAQADYDLLERSIVNDPGMDAVLVSVDHIKSLRAAYPNYYLDTTQFVSILDRALTT